MNTDYAELFTLVEESIGSPVRLYAWGEYRIEWDVEYDIGQLYFVDDRGWTRLSFREDGLSFSELARMAVME